MNVTFFKGENAPCICVYTQGMLDEYPSYCPYCGEPLDLLLDASGGSQDYVEDCSVCCRPFEVQVRVGTDGEIAGVTLKRDDE